MRSLDRNRVFDTKELEQLREDTYTVFEQAITVSEQYNQDRDEVMDLFDRVPAEARSSRFPLSLPTDFVYPLYADQQKNATIPLKAYSATSLSLTKRQLMQMKN